MAASASSPFSILFFLFFTLPFLGFYWDKLNNLWLLTKHKFVYTIYRVFGIRSQRDSGGSTQRRFHLVLALLEPSYFQSSQPCLGLSPLCTGQEINKRNSGLPRGQGTVTCGEKMSLQKQQLIFHLCSSLFSKPIFYFFYFYFSDWGPSAVETLL